MDPTLPRTRRTFLADLGRGGAALIALSVVGCGQGVTPRPSSVATPSGAAGTSPALPSESVPPGPYAWQRVDLGFVSAYVLSRAGEVVVVDTGVEGSEDDIEGVLAALGHAWDDVGRVILTHRHPDHVGSLPAVLERATAARAYAGAEDIPAIASPRELQAVVDGDDVAGLRIVATPGHTAGHVSVLDPLAGILVAGDALRTADGRAVGPDPAYTDDMILANASVATLATLRFETLLVGHGDPIETGADAQVAALAAGG